MKKFIVPFLASLVLASCVTAPQWTMTPKTGAITAETKIAYIADNKSLDNKILLGLRSRGLPLVKKFDPNTEIPAEYQYVLKIDQALGTVTYGSYYGSKDSSIISGSDVIGGYYNYIMSLSFDLDDRANEPFAIFKYTCGGYTGDDACLDQALDSFSQTVLGTAAPTQK